ncbi:MAG: hypothetical protein OXH11_21365 [Candidatus Aminicenantes bacterium]|nr:hypothetical protein [Candidatus Aminicenantes bacterium]
MNLPKRQPVISAIAAAAMILAASPIQGATPVLDAMKEELQRSVKLLSQQPTPVYYLSFEVTEDRRAMLRASFGNVAGNFENTQRLLDIDLRVGSPELDNTHPIRGDFFANMPDFSRVEVPLEDLDALRKILWYETDKKYKKASEQLTKVRANVQVKVKEEDQAGDFSAESPEMWLEDPASVTIDQALWEEKLRRYTAPFQVPVKSTRPMQPFRPTPRPAGM